MYSYDWLENLFGAERRAVSHAFQRVCGSEPSLARLPPAAWHSWQLRSP
jgi:hypothetical protein